MYSRDNKIMRKLLGKAIPDNSTDTSSPGLGITSVPQLQAVYRPQSSQYAVYDAHYPIYSVDASADRRAAVLASRHILKTVVFDGLTVTEGVDVRAAIVAASNPNKVNASAATSDQLSVKEVKWHHKDSTLFTACQNGKIFAYDLARIATGGSATDCIQMREDSRQVNTLDINPHRPSLLLSGSQDGFVRYFDIRAPVQSRAGGVTYMAKAAFKCNADGVRQVRWSPKEGVHLACGTDAGAVLKWDLRKPSIPLLRITAHEKACSSISWHPDGNHLVSGGWDQKCAVWDLSKDADKRQKPKWVLSTPAPVSVVSWRPALWSASARGKRAAQVAVSYDDASVKRFGIRAAHIWDFARPTLPFKELGFFESPPSSLMWLDQDILWAAGEDGRFHQCDLAFAPKVVDRLPSSSVAFSSRGDVAMFLDERPLQRPRSVVTHHQEAGVVPRSSYGSSPTTPLLSISRSDSEDDVVGSFLSPRRRMGRRRGASLRSIPAMSTTPPTTGEEQVLGLEQVMKFTGIFKTQQAMAVGRIPSASKASSYQYLSQCYLETLERDLPYVPGGRTLVERVTSILEQFACAAEKVSQFRLAQTWRILGFAMHLLLTRRAQYHLESRLGHFRKRLSMAKSKDGGNTSELKGLEVVVEDKSGGEEGAVGRRQSIMGNGTKTAWSLPGRSLLSQEMESTSNVATPVAAPVNGEGDMLLSGNGGGMDRGIFRPGKLLTPVVELDGFTLPPPAAAPSSHNYSSPKQQQAPDSTSGSLTSRESDHTRISSTEGYDFYDTDTLAHAVDVPDPAKRDNGGGGSNSRRHSYGQRQQPKQPPRVTRHDSDDSFSKVFATSEGSNRRATSTLSSTLQQQGGLHGPARSQFETLDENDEEDDGEYESRIRGREIEDSPNVQDTPLPLRRGLIRTQSPEELFLISQTTMTSDTFTSEEPSQQTPQSYVSDTRDFEDHAPLHVGVAASSPSKQSPELHLHVSPTIVEGDFLPWSDDPPYPHPLLSSPASPSSSACTSPPLDPYSLITRALDFELRTSVLNASAMILLLKPLLPESLVDSNRAGSILRSYHARLASMRLFVEAALLRNLCVKGWPEGLPDWGEQYTAIFGPAQQGVKGGLLCPSCKKPREVDPKKGPGALWQCDRCKVHMAPCAVCGHRESTAAVLPVTTAVAAAAAAAATTATAAATSLSQKSDNDLARRVDDIMSLWWYCPGCAHGGHATCIQGWHAPHGFDTKPSSTHPVSVSIAQDGSDGCCPLDGCGHACLPGKWRDEKSTLRAEEVSRAAAEKTRAGGGGGGRGTGGARKVSNAGTIPSRNGSPTILPMGSTIRGDGVEVPQSRAVESVRETLAAAGRSGASGGGGGGGTILPGAGILSSSPGRYGERDRERRKSVKFVATER